MNGFTILRPSTSQMLIQNYISPFAQLVVISHNYVKEEKVCYFWVTFKDLSQKEDDLVSVKIKILKLRNAL